MLSLVMLNVVILSLVVPIVILIFSALENEDPDVLLQVELQVPML
jgi:hypothetical protein